MSYVYKITNNINGKMYIGQTSRSLSERFEEHCYEARVQRFADRPLYAAMIKYGVEHFLIELIEETDQPKEREIYWIEFYETFKNGYNATFGGDGKRYIDYDLVVSTYKQIGNMVDTANLLEIHPDSVYNILKLKDEYRRSSADIQIEKRAKPIDMFDLDGKYLRSFVSSYDAARYLIRHNLTNCKLTTIKTHISEVCKGKRKSAAGFRWVYVQNIEDK
jgi:group I intron endonuclease